MRDKITAEVRRYKQFQQMLLGNRADIDVKDIDIRNYCKFILQEGDIEEKRDFLRCLKSEVANSEGRSFGGRNQLVREMREWDEFRRFVINSRQRL